MVKAAIFARALGEATRWRIACLVTEQALCICELADILEMPQSSVSSHVQVLRKAGLLESEKREKWTYFQIHLRFVPLVRNLKLFFEESEAYQLDSDKANAAARLIERQNSCCPGPEKLLARVPK